MEDKGITSSVISSAYIKLFGYGESTVELCGCGSRENELHRNRGMSFNSNVIGSRVLSVQLPSQDDPLLLNMKDHCKKLKGSTILFFLL